MHGMHVAEMPVAVLYERPPEVPDCSWTIYFEATAEMEDMLADVERLGGQVIVPKFTIESGGDFGIAMDPTGAVFGLIKSLSPDSAEPAAAS